MPMGWTSENLASDFDVSRADMDEFAALSFQRAERAQKAGLFTNEIVPFTAFVKDPETGKRTTRIITQDDGIRYGTTKETLGKIRPAFPQWGRAQTTGGNASQITDGAAAVLLMSRRKAQQLGVKILSKYVTTAVTGVAPRVMGIGPLYAIPLALENKDILARARTGSGKTAAYCIPVVQKVLSAKEVSFDYQLCLWRVADSEMPRRTGFILACDVSPIANGF